MLFDLMERTSDGRILDKRVIINKKILKQILLNIKLKKQLSWKSFAIQLGVCEQTLSHDWLTKESTIPLELFEKVIKMDEEMDKSKIIKNIKIIEPFWGQKIINGKDKSKNIKIPDKNSEDLAEFYGIMLGDGCLFSDLKALAITADQILENDYFRNYLDKLIYNLFKLHPKFYPDKNTRAIRCVLYSKNVVKYLSDLNFPIGTKKDLHLPDFITKNKKSLTRCLRGLMDTDGSLSAHPHSKIMIHLSITSKTLREEVANSLIGLGIKPGVFNKGIMLYSKNAIKFCEIMGFSNLKNKIKYREFKKTGKVPKTKETEKLLKNMLVSF
jgi:hypothetical protein